MQIKIFDKAIEFIYKQQMHRTFFAEIAGDS